MQLDGESLFGTDITWSVYYNWGRRSRDDLDLGQFFGPALSNAMGPSADLDGDGTPECYSDVNDPSSVIAGCVPFNFFGGPFSVTQEMIDYVGIDLVDSFNSELDQYGLDFAGSFWGLRRRIGLGRWLRASRGRPHFFSDATKQKDEVTGNTGLGTSGSIKVDSYYVELLAPVLDNFEVSLGWRYEDFSSYGSNDVFKVGARWDITDSLAIRGTWGEVFRAPGVFDLYQGQVDSFPTYLDPCSDRAVAANGAIAPGCAQQSEQLDTQVLAKVGGNPFLKAEEGETTTIGVVWTPTFGDLSMELTVDYWDLELEDGITTLGVNYTLNDCYENQNQGSCSLILGADYNRANPGRSNQRSHVGVIGRGRWLRRVMGASRLPFEQTSCGPLP